MRFLKLHFDCEFGVPPEVTNVVEQEFARRRKALEDRQARGRELQKQVVVKNCSIDIEEEGAKATPAASSRARSVPCKHYVDGRSGFLRRLAQWLMDERLDVDLTTIARFAPWLSSRYTINKKCRRSLQHYVLSAADVEAGLKELFEELYRIGHKQDPRKFELDYEREFTQRLADEDLLTAIWELHDAGQPKESVLGTAELLREHSPRCSACRLGDLAQQLKRLKDEGRLRHVGGKLECA